MKEAARSMLFSEAFFSMSNYLKGNLPWWQYCLIAVVALGILTLLVLTYRFLHKRRHKLKYADACYHPKDIPGELCLACTQKTTIVCPDCDVPIRPGTVVRVVKFDPLSVYCMFEKNVLFLGEFGSQQRLAVACCRLECPGVHDMATAQGDGIWGVRMGETTGIMFFPASPVLRTLPRFKHAVEQENSPSSRSDPRQRFLVVT